MRSYLSSYGWHFSKALCDCAVAKLRNRDGNTIKAYDKEKVEELLDQNNIQLQNNRGYDAVYICNYAMAKYLGSSIKDQAALANYVRDYLDDRDAAPTKALDEYVGRCIGKGEPIIWEDAM